MKLNTSKLRWTRKPADYTISDDKIEIITAPHTDLWQRTYYHFRNDNAPVLQMETDEQFFSFTVKTEFESKHRFDQCGMVPGQFNLVFMRAVLKTHLLKLPLQIWKLLNANGSRIMDSSQMKSNS